MRLPARSLLLRGLALALSMAVFVACSSDGDGGGATAPNDTEATPQDADAYAATVCGALSDWLASLEQGATTMQENLQEETDLGNVKQGVLDFLDETLTTTDQMMETIEGAGAPDAENGEQVHEEIVSTLGQARTLLQDARDSIDELDASNQQELAEGLQGVGTALQGASIGEENPLENTGSDELDQAFEDEPSCAEIQSMAA